jgi:hypothetical protein
VCAACLVASLAACSSSGHKAGSSSSTTRHTTTTVAPATTLPTPASITTVKTWFAAHGQPLIEFERVTAPLATGKVPTAAACLKFIKTDLPHVTKDQNTLVALAEQIPNADLENAVEHDVAQKLLVGRGCGEAVLSNRPIPVGTPAAWASVRGYSDTAHLWLSRFGITV